MRDLPRVPVIESARLKLRCVTEHDLDPLAAMFADPNYMRFFGDGKTADRAAAWRAIATALGHWILRGYGIFAVDERDSGSFIGWSGLIYPEGAPAIELGWGIAPHHWNRGFATEAATAVRDFAFGTLQLPRLVSLIHPANAPSVRVAEKIGEHFENMLDVEGGSVAVYAIVNRDVAPHTSRLSIVR